MVLLGEIISLWSCLRRLGEVDSFPIFSRKKSCQTWGTTGAREDGFLPIIPPVIRIFSHKRREEMNQQGFSVKVFPLVREFQVSPSKRLRPNCKLDF